MSDEPQSADGDVDTFAGMRSLRDGYVAVVVGSTGGLGSAMIDVLRSDSRCGTVIGLSRSTGLDLLEESSIEQASVAVGALHGEIDLLFIATGILNVPGLDPERSMRSWTSASLLGVFAVNTVGPALVLKHFLPLLRSGTRSVCGVASARLGSIGENGLGGWVSYRVSKSGLNQVVRTASIELGRRCGLSVVAGYHPGTLATGFSAGRGAGLARRDPGVAARLCLGSLDVLPVGSSGGFFDAFGGSIAF